MSGSKKNILIVSSFFSATHVAANRNAALFKYLREAGHNVWVLTDEISSCADPEEEKYVVRFNSASILNRLSFDRPTSRYIHKLKALWNYIRFFIIADEKPGFYIHGRKSAESLIKEKGIDVILTSVAPIATLKMGLYLKKRIPSLFWIADFRDEIITEFNQGTLAGFQALKLERQALLRADIVSSVSSPILSDMKKRSLTEPRCAFLEIRNGFDFDVRREAEKQKDIFRIYYAGTFYGHKNPKYLFEALMVLQKKIPSFSFLIEIIGNQAPLDIPAKIKSFVHTRGSVAYSSLPETLESASAFLLIQPTNSRRGVFSGKIFDYMAINRPIIGMTEPEDSAGEILVASRSGLAARNEDVDGVAKIIEKIYTQWKSGTLPERDWEIVEAHHRRRQIEPLEKIIRMVPRK